MGGKELRHLYLKKNLLIFIYVRGVRVVFATYFQCLLIGLVKFLRE
jgi:hypothetical protein